MFSIWSWQLYMRVLLRGLMFANAYIRGILDYTGRSWISSNGDVKNNSSKATRPSSLEKQILGNWLGKTTFHGCMDMWFFFIVTMLVYRFICHLRILWSGIFLLSFKKKSFGNVPSSYCKTKHNTAWVSISLWGREQEQIKVIVDQGIVRLDISRPLWLQNRMW